MPFFPISATLSPLLTSKVIGLNIVSLLYFICKLCAKINGFLLLFRGIIFNVSFTSIFFNKLVFSFIAFSELYFLFFVFSASFDHFAQFLEAISSLFISFCNLSFCIFSKLSCLFLFSFQDEKLPCCISILVLFIEIIWFTTLSKKFLSWDTNINPFFFSK